MRSSRGFTLIELSVVLFVLGLLLWLAAPRLAAFVEPGRDAFFRRLSAASEAAFDRALFGRREARLVIDPVAGTWRPAGEAEQPPPPEAVPRSLRITGIRLDGEDRLLEGPVEIVYLPGGAVPEARIFLRDEGRTGEPLEWTLVLDPADGSFQVLEGTVTDHG